MPEVLVALPGGAGVVRRDDGEVVVTHDVTRDDGQRLRAGDRYQPVKAWLDEDRCLVGGLLAPGSATAEVVDDRGSRINAHIGDGAYVAVLEHPLDGHEPIVCCRDGAGTVVRRPLGGDYPRAAVKDAEEPCPACGALAFDECLPTEPWRAGTPGPDGTIIPSPIIVCRTCGHAVTAGTFFASAGPCDDNEDHAAREARIARAQAHARAQRWYSDTMTLRAVTFPIYAAERWRAMIAGSGSEDDQLTRLTIGHHDTPDADPHAGDQPRLEITTSNEDLSPGEEAREARRTLEAWLWHDGVAWPDASEAARTLWLDARRREVRQRVLLATSSEQAITIDGTPQRFFTLTSPTGRWVATRRHHDLTVTVAGRDLDPATIDLEPMPNPAARLLGPEPEDPEQ